MLWVTDTFMDVVTKKHRKFAEENNLNESNLTNPHVWGLEGVGPFLAMEPAEYNRRAKSWLPQDMLPHNIRHVE